MKRILVVLMACALSAGVQAQNQQGQGVNAALDAAAMDAVKKDKDKSDKDITDAKAAGKASTWMDRAKTYQSIAAQYIRMDSTAATTAYEAYNKVVELDKDKKGGPGRLAKEAQEALKSQQMYGAFMQQGVAKFQGKSYADAIKAMTMAGDISPKDTTAPLYSAIAAQQIKDNATAKTQLEKYITAGGRDPQIYGSLALLYRADNEVDKALAALDKGIALAPSNKDLSSERVNLMLASNRMDDAIAGMKQLVEKDPNNAQNLVNLGIVYDNGATAAEEEYRKLGGDGKQAGGNKKRLAAEKDALTAINSEITRLNAAIKKKPSAELKRQLTDVQSRRTETQASVTKLEAQVKEEDAKAAAAGDNTGKVAELKQKVTDQRNMAKEYYTKALAVDPNNYDANFNMGRFYYNEAAELNKQLGALDMKDYQSAKGKELEGRVCGRFKKALPFFTKAKATKDNEADLNEILSTLQENLKRMEGQKVACNEAE